MTENRFDPINLAYHEALSNFADKPLEGELPNKEICALLVLPNLPKSNSAGPEPARFIVVDTLALLEAVHGRSGTFLNK